MYRGYANASTGRGASIRAATQILNSQSSLCSPDNYEELQQLISLWLVRFRHNTAINWNEKRAASAPTTGRRDSSFTPPTHRTISATPPHPARKPLHVYAAVEPDCQPYYSAPLLVHLAYVGLRELPCTPTTSPASTSHITYQVLGLLISLDTATSIRSATLEHNASTHPAQYTR